MKTPTATVTLESENLYVACGDGIIHALRARDGAVVERLYKTVGPSASALALSAGVLYNGEFNGRGNPGDTALVARDITTGRELWRTATQETSSRLQSSSRIPSMSPSTSPPNIWATTPSPRSWHWMREVARHAGVMRVTK